VPVKALELLSVSDKCLSGHWNSCLCQLSAFQGIGTPLGVNTTERILTPTVSIQSISTLSLSLSLSTEFSFANSIQIRYLHMRRSRYRLAGKVLSVSRFCQVPVTSSHTVAAASPDPLLFCAEIWMCWCLPSCLHTPSILANFTVWWRGGEVCYVVLAVPVRCCCKVCWSFVRTMVVS
jgi:hypothetical protein